MSENEEKLKEIIEKAAEELAETFLRQIYQEQNWPKENCPDFEKQNHE